jgi:sigma-B regulation protein RsbU (phosphoserine phosphatase)
MAIADNNLRLELVAGPPVELPVVSSETGGELIVGRSHQCGLALMEESVSRRHASLAWHHQRWMLTDLGSRHGTALNGVRLNPADPAELLDDDLIRIGPWTLRVNLGPQRTTYASTVDDSVNKGHRIEPVRAEQTVRLAQHRLNLIIECAAAMTCASDERALAQAVVESALAGSGFERAALIRTHTGSDDVEILAHSAVPEVAANQAGPAEFTFSRSLVRAAGDGQMTRLATDTAGAPMGASVVELGITAALCAPIMLGESITAFLYLDLRERSAGRIAAAPDAASFCQVMARLCGLALANLKRMDLERRQKRLEHEVMAAREAQVLLLPPDEGDAGPIRYAVKVRPGRFVAGDLFEVIELDHDRAAVCIGDVAGHGVGAGVLMAAAQAHLHAALRHHGDPAVAVNSLNRYITRGSDLGKFISLWVGVFDGRDRVLAFVDAGHGYWMHKPHDSPARRAAYEGGMPVGIDREHVYCTERMPLGQRDRIILYSDGAVEQRNPAGEQFSHERISHFIAAEADPATDVASVLRAVEEHAGRAELDDDTTVASIQWKENVLGAGC